MKNEVVIDPRISIIDERLKSIKNVIVVTGFKGGIGKSLISTVMAINLSKKGLKVGLFDLDITSSVDHIILGVDKKTYPSEEKGIIPPLCNDIKFMSFFFYSISRPVAMRGRALADSFRELLASVIWGELDFLIIDMPAGFSDLAIEIMELINNFIVIAVSTPSPLSKSVIAKSIEIYKEKGLKIFYIENMSDKNLKNTIRYDIKIDLALGNIEKIIKTNFYKDIDKISKNLISLLNK